MTLYIRGILSLLIICVSLNLSCSKEKRKKWIIAEITVIDAVTKEPLKSRVKHYASSSHIGNRGFETEEVELGYTNDQGSISIEHETISRVGEVYLTVFPDDPVHWQAENEWFGGPTFGYASIELENRKKHIETIELQPLYPYHLTIQNNNCLSASDLLSATWGTKDGFFEYEGCGTVQVFRGSGWNGASFLNEVTISDYDYTTLDIGNYTGITTSQTLDIDYAVTRGSNTTTSTQTFNLERGVITEIILSY